MSTFTNIKSKYICKKIFNHLKERKSLEIIKYYKNIKKRLDINTNNYKEYSEKYSPIEIEIKTVNNEYGKFINIQKKDIKFYHIYFNNSKEEIQKKYSIEIGEHIKNIKIIIDYKVRSFEYLFIDCLCNESINFKIFNRNNINNMSYMFYNCKSLKELNLNNFNTNNVTLCVTCSVTVHH